MRLEVASWNPLIALEAKVVRGIVTELHGGPSGSSSKVELRGFVLCAPKNGAERLPVIKEPPGGTRNGKPNSGCIFRGASRFKLNVFLGQLVRKAIPVRQKVAHGESTSSGVGLEGNKIFRS